MGNLLEKNEKVLTNTPLMWLALRNLFHESFLIFLQYYSHDPLLGYAM